MSKKTTFEEFKQQIEESQPGRNFTFIGYEAMMKPLTVICNDCGFRKDYSTAQSFRNIQSHFQCNCEKYSKRGSGFKKRYNLSDFQQKIDDKFGENTLEALNFTKMLEPTDIKCRRCGRIIHINSAAKLFNRQNPCFYCDNKNKKRFEDYQKDIDKIFGEDEFDLLEIKEHTSRNEKKVSLIRHKCGFIQTVGYYDFLKSKGCPKCSGRASRYEIRVNTVLKELGINYAREYRKGFNNQFCFDFALLNEEKNPIGFIEVDGQQHFPGPRPDNWLSFEDQHKKDLEKDLKAKELNIPLLRIPYFNINDSKKLINDFLTFIDYPVREQEKSEKVSPLE